VARRNGAAAEQRRPLQPIQEPEPWSAADRRPFWQCPKFQGIALRACGIGHVALAVAVGVLVPALCRPRECCGVPRTVRLEWTERQTAMETAVQEEAGHGQPENQH